MCMVFGPTIPLLGPQVGKNNPRCEQRLDYKDVYHSIVYGGEKQETT